MLFSLGTQPGDGPVFLWLCTGLWHSQHGVGGQFGRALISFYQGSFSTLCSLLWFS